MSHKVSEDLSFLTSKSAYYILYSCINMFDFTNLKEKVFIKLMIITGSNPLYFSERKC